MLKAQNKGILKKLNDVDTEMLPSFEETADLLIKQHKGDAKMALKVALAYCSGHYKQVIPMNSLLNGRNGYQTIKMNVGDGKQLDESAAMSIITKYWAPRIADTIGTMKNLQDGSGVVFDLRIDLADGFIENYELLKERDPRRVDFECKKCSKLPDGVEGA